MRDEGSPYRKAATTAMAAPLHLRSLPRRVRVLAFAGLCLCLLLLLPRSGSGIDRSQLRFLGFGKPQYDVLDYVDPLIGTANGGHVFPGATLPYGMAKAVADTQSRGDNAAGFVWDEHPIQGFSHMHDSGTGGHPSMGNFPLFVHPGCPNDDFAQCAFSVMHRPTPRVTGSAYAAPGYFRVNLTNGVQAEMTTTAHAVLYRFGFPGNATIDVPLSDTAAAFATGAVPDDSTPLVQSVPYSPLILVDLVDLMNSRQTGGIQVYPGSGRVVGEGRYMPSFGTGKYHAFFCADFAGAAIRRTGTFRSNNATEQPKFLDDVGGGYAIPTGSAGAWLQFDPPASGNHSMLARVGVSFISVDQACGNAEREIGDWHFERVESEARKAWREKLNAVEVDAAGVSEELLTTFWSGLYRTMLSPQNYTGENPLWNSTEPYYDSFYCIWDSFRAQHPLLTIIDPDAQTEMVRALLDIYRHEGKLPDCRMSFSKGFTQGGSNADVVIADAFIKNLTKDIDWETAYEAVVSDAELEPRNWGLEGRGNLVSWHDVGYIPWDDTDTNGTGPASRTISRGVEYAYNDFCIAQLAAALGGGDPNRAADAAKYRRRGANWRNYWNPSQRDLFKDATTGDVYQTSFTGFPQPRLRNGTFHYQPTRACSPVESMHSCYYDTALDTYEGSPWLYSFYAPHDMANLVALMGGAGGFVERLRYFHTSGIAYLGNEQAFLPVFQFHYAGRPALSGYFAREYIPGLFNASVNGIPGNDDCAMGAFSAFAMMGFFPVAGQDVYLLSAPFFPEVRVRAKEEGRWAVIRVVNFDPEGARKYVQRATLNGKGYTKSWITHEFFLRGGVLELWVGEEEGAEWGRGERDLPPSYYPVEGGHD